MAQTTIRPNRVRYIKLGRHGGWEQECLERQIIRIGFGSANPEKFALCESGQWQEIATRYVAEGRDKGTANRFAAELRLFCEDDGSTLWLTFARERLYWAFLTRTGRETMPIAIARLLGRAGEVPRAQGFALARMLLAATAVIAAIADSRGVLDARGT